MNAFAETLFPARRAVIVRIMPAAEAGLIRNHTIWRDAEGQPIDCHEGAIIRVGDTFHWYGRVYAANPEGIYGTGGMQYRCGFIYYSSTDLVNRTNRGMILTYPESGWLTEGTWHRPRMIYHAPTKKYVLWFFRLQKAYPPPPVVATADAPTGPFTVLGQVKDDFVSGDLATFLDDDGQGYLCHDGGPTGRQAMISRMTPDFLSLTKDTLVAMPPDIHRESECPTRYKGRYLVAASGISGLHAGVGESECYYAVENVGWMRE